MNIVSNLIFHYNNCDASRAFATTRESTAAASSSGLLNAEFPLKGTSPTNIFARLVRLMNAYNFVADSFHKKKLRCKLSSSNAILDGTVVLRF